MIEYSFDEQYENFNEDETPYESPMRQHIETLIGKEATEKLYGHFDSTNDILKCNEAKYLSLGLSKDEVNKLEAAKNLSFEPYNKQIRSSKDAYGYVKHLGYLDVEHFLVIVLDNAKKVMKVLTIGTGGFTGVIVDTAALFGQVLAYNAKGIILAHNHPSGETTPSPSDIDLTKKVTEGAKLLNIKVPDHLIVAHDKYLSFADEGYL